MNNTVENCEISSISATLNNHEDCHSKITTVAIRSNENIKESALDKVNFNLAEKEHEDDAYINACIQQNSSNKTKNATLIKKKKMKSESNYAQSKKITKCKMKPLSDNGMSNINAEALIHEDDSKFALSCRFCQKAFETLEKFTDHDCRSEKYNSKTKTLKCKYCSATFSLNHHLDKHVKGHKRNDCTICSAQFTKRKALCKHLKAEHNIIEPEKFYNCSFCDKHFSKRRSLNAHLKYHANGQHLCLRCGFMCEDESEYNEHLKEHIRNLKYECDLCGKKFVRRQQYDQHMMGHARHSCSSCNTTFSTKKLLVKHQQSVHGAHIIEKKHACPICKKMFLRPKHLQIHQRIHTDEKLVKCSHCETIFCSDRALAKHMKTVRHLQRVNTDKGKIIEIEKRFLCSICGARFYRQQSLLRHTEVKHSACESIKCPHCEYSTKCKTNLKRHIELHTNNKRFICELCGSSFHAFATLKEHHAFVHSENRSFICTVCNKGFKSKSTLQRHARIHSEVRPYKCHCNRDYKRMSHLKRHMASAHHMTFKKNEIFIISKSTDLVTNPNSEGISDILVEQLEMLQDNSSSDEFSLLPASNTAMYNQLDDSIRKKSSDEHLSEAATKDDKFPDVPSSAMQTLLDKNDVHILSDGSPKNSLSGFVPTPCVKTPPIYLQTDHNASNSISLDDPNLNLSSNTFCSFNLPSSPLSSISMESVTHQPIASQDILSFSSATDSLRPHSLPNLNFQNQTSNIDSFAVFSLHNSDSPTAMQIQSFLLNSDISSPPHVSDLNLEQTTTSKQLFGDSDDILSLTPYAPNSQLSGAACSSENLFSTARDIELWDTSDNNSRLKISDSELIATSTCANSNFTTNLTCNANNLLAHNLIFSSDSLMICSLDNNTLNSDFDSLTNLC